MKYTTREKECRSKRRYASRDEAQAEADLRILVGETRKELSNYYCIWCGGYHLTSARNRQDALGDL